MGLEIPEFDKEKVKFIDESKWSIYGSRRVYIRTWTGERERYHNGCIFMIEHKNLNQNKQDKTKHYFNLFQRESLNQFIKES